MCDQLIILRVLRKELNKMTKQNLEAPVIEIMKKTKEYEFDCIICSEQFVCKKEIKSEC